MYSVDAKSYLERARERLNEERLESLFYAALELRCGIEARLQQYLEAQEHIAKCRRSGWQIPKLAKNIERAFKLGNKIARVTIFAPDTEKQIASFLYTPVTSELQKNGQRLGNLLHALKRGRPVDDPWWGETRAFLGKVADQLAVAASGTLLGPMIWNPKTGQATMRHTLDPGEDPKTLMEKIGEIGTRSLLHSDRSYSATTSGLDPN
jgi:hypothetical protein